MEEKQLSYQIDGKNYQGYIVTPSKVSAQSPAILIAHTYRGLDDLIKQRARELARKGYIAMAADLYGEGKVAATDDEAVSLMLPLFRDRTELQKRVTAAFHLLETQPHVKKDAICAIGFCFGGLTVIELLRSGVDVKGIVSFHGVLGYALGDNKATAAKPKKMQGAALILHGNDDPLVSEQDIRDLKKEFTEAGLDWQFHIYGHTVHAFTNPGANDTAHGLVYNKKANARSWIAMHNFFDEILK